MERVTVNDANTGHSLELLMSPEMIERCRIDQEYLRNIIMQSDSHNTSDVPIFPEVEVNDSVPVEYDNSENTNLENSENIYRWRDSTVLELLSLYEENQAKLEDPKISKKKFWELIAAGMVPPLTGPQCMTKFRALQKYYKSVKDHNAKSGNDKKIWKYYDRMDEIFGNRAWANPVAIISSDPAGRMQGTSEQLTFTDQSHIIRPTLSPGSSTAPPAEAPSSSSSRKRMAVDAKLDNIAELLKKKIAQKEEHEKNRERRHKELLDILRTL